MSLLELDNVSYNYHAKEGEIEAIKNLSFSVEKGEFVALVGPSGCGKSTILSLISGLITPSKGEILYKGMKMPKELPIGYMLQRDCLFPWRTILQNACLSLEIKKQTGENDIKYVKELLNKYDLSDFLNKYPSSLSGGMRQRVAIIRTLSTRPNILLLDEPTSALDYQTRLNVSNDIYNIIKSEKKTAILVTHDISEAISMADKIIVLTRRPATLSMQHILSFPKVSPLQKRENEMFTKLFEMIWKELNE